MGVLQTSTDDGATWNRPTRWPNGFFGPLKNKPVTPADGRLVHITYTRRRKVIQHVVVDPTKLMPRDLVDGAWPE